jgi:hypothetical protein
MDAMEPSLAGQLKLEEFRRALPRYSVDELRECCSRLAELALVTQPAAMRWVVKDTLDLLAEAKAGPTPAGAAGARHEAMADDLRVSGAGDHH